MYKEIKTQLEEIMKFVENDVQDDWYIYSTLRDKLKRLEILLRQNEVI